MIDIIGLDDFKTAFWGLLGMMGVAGIHVGKGVVSAQRERDVRVHDIEKKMADYQLKVTDEYAKKSEIARLHDRIDNVNQKLDDLPHKVIELMRSK